MLLPIYGVGGRSSHDNLQYALLVIAIVLFRPELADSIVQVNTDSPAHADNHCLPIHRLQALLPVLDYVLGDLLDALLGTHQLFDSSPFSFDALRLLYFLPLGDLCDFFVDNRTLILI